MFEFQRGPVFAHIVLADEINRATPKTQSALLEAMQEQGVTVGGKVHRLENPFMVLATQNPIEMEGTYPLPEAQVDRFFFKLLLQYPNRAELGRIADLTTAAPPAALREVLDGAGILEMRQWVREVPLAEVVKDYAVRLVLSTHPREEGKNGGESLAQRFVLYGSSPRGLQSLILAAKARALLAGRPNVSFDDIRAMLLPSLRHRLILNLEADAEGIGAEKILSELIDPGCRSGMTMSLESRVSSLGLRFQRFAALLAKVARRARGKIFRFPRSDRDRHEENPRLAVSQGRNSRHPNPKPSSTPTFCASSSACT